MSGLSNIYTVTISDGSSFFKEMNIYTSRYDSVKNYLQLFPNNTDIKVNESFLKTTLENLGAKIEYTQTWMYKPTTQGSVYTIEVSGLKVRDAVDRLFQKSQISAYERSIVEDPIRELEKCLDFHSRLSNEFSLAQKEIIEGFVEPYIGILKDEMNNFQIEKSLGHACIIVESYLDPEKTFNRLMCPILNEYGKWDNEAQNETMEALYMIAKVLTGKSNLEGALLQSGAKLPSLETTKQIVMTLLKS